MKQISPGTLKELLEGARRARVQLDPRVPNYQPQTWPATRAPLRIGIVGGGIAGLAAGWLLKHLGHNVVIFEAQSRPGGRIHTIDLDTHPVEVGAARFSDQHHRAIHWIKKFSLQLEPMYPTHGGRLVKLTEAERQIGRDVAVLSTHDVHHLVSHHETWPRQFSSNASLARNLMARSITRPTWYRIRGGNAQLPYRIANELKHFISYESPVRRIVQAEDQVEITCLTRGLEHRQSFDRCVVAVPLATHSEIEASPPLTNARRSLVESIHAQPAVRTFALIRDRSALKQDRLCGFGCTSDGFEIWQPSFSSRSENMVLVLYAQGDATTSLLNLDDETRDQTSLDVLEQMFPGVKSKSIEARSYSWVRDPWARGAQSLIHRYADRESLQRPEGRLHFAGEHTTGGWVDDALASADRVVREICAGRE